jgi:Fe-S oxidoreductase
MMTDPDLHQNRLDWLEDDLRTSKDSDTLYFAGCLPYYDAVFKKQGFEGVEIARSAVKILNHLGVEPIVLADERCCGHDQLWEGDTETFQQLAELNLQSFAESGAKRIVTTCPECARTLKVDYPQYAEDHGLEVLHIAELIAEGDLSFLYPASIDAPRVERNQATYQDPCRLGRHLGVYDAPRKVIGDLGYELIEMSRTRKASLCCGTSCWTSCGQVSKNIQVERLEEARSTGAQLLVTACLKCQIHFKCAQDDPMRGEEIDIEIRDLTTLAAERLAPVQRATSGLREKLYQR